MRDRRKLWLPLRISIFLIVMIISSVVITFGLGAVLIILFSPLIAGINLLIGLGAYKAGFFWDNEPRLRVLIIVLLAIAETSIAGLIFLFATYRQGWGFELCIDACSYFDALGAIMVFLPGAAIAAALVNGSIAGGYIIGYNNSKNKFTHG